MANGLLGGKPPGQKPGIMAGLLDNAVSPQMLMAMGLLQMGQERPFNQPAQGGNLLAAAGAMQTRQKADATRAGQEQAKMAAEQKKMELEQEQRRQAQQIATALHQFDPAANPGITGQQVYAQALAQSANLHMVPDFRETIEALGDQLGYARVKPTGRQQDVAALGLPPGSPEFQAALRENMNRPSVQINNAPALPPNMMPRNPKDLSEGVVPIPGSLADEAVQERKAAMAASRKEAATAKKRLDVLASVDDALAAYKKLIEKHGTEFGGTKANDLKTAYTHSLLKLKDYFGLGALQQADMDTMAGQLGDASAFENQIHGGGRFLSQLEQLQARLDEERARELGKLPTNEASKYIPRKTGTPGGTPGGTNDDEIRALLKKYGAK